MMMMTMMDDDDDDDDDDDTVDMTYSYWVQPQEGISFNRTSFYLSGAWKMRQ